MAFELYGPELTTQECADAIAEIAGDAMEYIEIDTIVTERWQMQGVTGRSIKPPLYGVVVHLVRHKPRNTYTLEFKGERMRALVCQFEERLAEMKDKHVF